MSKITRTRNSTRRISFAWTTTDAAGNTAPLDLTGCTLQMLIAVSYTHLVGYKGQRVTFVPIAVTYETLAPAKDYKIKKDQKQFRSF